MSAAAEGGNGPGPGSGPSNPRKFSEKIALHNQRQAEETAAFQEVMMDISSTRLQAQKVRLAQCQGTYYGGSLPNVNQIGNSTSEFQGPFHLNLDSARGARHHGLLDRAPRDRRLMPPLRHYRRQIDSSPYSSAYLSPPPDTSWRRTNSDSALHTSVMNPNVQDSFNCGPGLAPQNRRSGLADAEGGRMYPYPVPPIEENMLDERKQLLKPWDTKKFPILSSRPKSCEVPGINIFPSPEQHSSSALIPSALNTGGSLPDLTSLHFPSPLPTPLDPDEPPFPSLSGGSSTGNLASTLTQLGFGVESAFHSQGPSSLQGSFSNPSLQSSLSNPNILSSLSSLPFQTSFSNPSLQSSLKSSLQSSPSNQSLQSSLSNASLLSSVGNSSLGSLSIQSTASNPSYSSGVGSSSSSSSYSPMMMQSQQQPPAVSLSTSPRRRAPLSPLLLPLGGDLRRHHPKQFSPTISPTLSSITQGVPLDTSKLPPYSYSQTHPPLPSQQPMQQQPSQQPLQHPQQSLQQQLQQQNQQQQQRQQLQQQNHQQQQQNHQQQQQQNHHQQQQQQQNHHQQQQQNHHQQQQQQQNHQQQLQQQNQQQLQQQNQQQLQQQNQQQLQQQNQQQLQQQNQQQLQQQNQQQLQQQNQQQLQQQNQQQLQQQQNQQQLQQQNQQQLQQQNQQQLQQQNQQQLQQQNQQQLQQQNQQQLQQQNQQQLQQQNQQQLQQQQNQQQLQQQNQQQLQQQNQQQLQQQNQQQQQQQNQQQQLQQQNQQQQLQQQNQQQQLQQQNQQQQLQQQNAQEPMQQQQFHYQNPPRTPQLSQSLVCDLNLYNESSLLSSLLDDPYLGLQLTARQTQALSQQLEQFNMESPAGSLSLSNNSSGGGGFPGELHGQTFSPAESGRQGGSHSNLQDPQLLNKQKQSCTGGRHGNVPSIILTGDSPPGLSKEITSALAGVPGFEFGQFSLDDALRMEPLALEGLGMLGEADLVLPDPSVEESFRSDRLK